MSAGVTTLEEDGWELVDAEMAARQYPETFVIPSISDRSGIGPGNLVRLRFVFRAENKEELPASETMHVRVKKSEGQKLVGMLEDTPVTSEVLRLGQEVHFEPRHVVDIIVSPKDPRHPLYAPSVMGRFANRVRAIIRGEWSRLG